MGYKSTSPKMILAIIGIVLLIVAAGAVILIKMGAISAFSDETKTSYESYKDFREDAGSFFLDTAPESAKDFKYYYSLKDNDMSSIVSFTIDDRDLLSMKNHYSSEFSSFGDSYKLTENEKVKSGFVKEEGIPYLEDFFSNNEADYKIFKYAKSDSATSKSWYGFLYNKSDGRVILFDITEYKQ
jgi:hypothetical protein